MKVVTIIGAGLGGLVSGAVLAQAGMKVRVLEQHLIPGGYATSFRRKTRQMSHKAEFEVSLHLMGDLGAGGALREVLNDIGVLDRLEFMRAHSLYRAVFPNEEIHVRDYETYLRVLEERFPEEREGIRALFHTFIRLRQEMLVLMQKTNNGLTADLLKDGPTLMAYNHASLSSVLDEFLHSPELKSVIAQQWQYYGLPPSQLSAVYYAYAWTEYILYGGFYPKGRSQTLSNTLAEIIKEHGGEIHTRQQVVKIDLQEGTVRGVETHKDYYPTDWVISNIDPWQTFDKLIGYEHLPRRYIKKLESIKPSLSCVQAYLLLNIDFPSQYGETDHEIFVNETYDLEQGFTDILEEQYTRMPLSITVYENLNPSYQVEGKTTMSLFILSRYEHWSDLSEDDYQAKKQQVTDILIERLDRLYPGITQYIEYVELSTPRTNHSYTSNKLGAIYGAQQSVDQCLHRRLPQKTPIEGLYLAGAWTQPGGGYSGVIWSGHNFAKQLLLQQKEVITQC